MRQKLFLTQGKFYGAQILPSLTSLSYLCSCFICRYKVASQEMYFSAFIFIFLSVFICEINQLSSCRIVSLKINNWCLVLCVFAEKKSSQWFGTSVYSTYSFLLKQSSCLLLYFMCAYELVIYLSNRPQVSMVYKLINHLGCWQNTRRICQARAAGEWFTNSSSVLPLSQVVYQLINHRNLWSIAFIY